MADSTNLKAALVAAVVAGERLRRTPVVDDDFPEVMHDFDGALRTARAAIDQDAGAIGDPLDPIGAVLATVRAELDRAVAKFPTWPTDPLHAIGVVQEEAGELAKAVLQAVYEPHKSGPTQVFEEAVQTAAMAVRFLLSSARYIYVPGEQHTQLLGEAPPLVGTGEVEAPAPVQREDAPTECTATPTPSCALQAELDAQPIRAPQLGQRQVLRPSLGQRVTQPGFSPCLRCMGRGVTGHGFACPACHGAGTIRRTVEA